MRNMAAPRGGNPNSKADAGFRAMTLDKTIKQMPHKSGRYVAVRETIAARVNSNIPDGGSAKQYKNQSNVKNKSAISGARFQARQKTLKSDYNFKEHRVVRGNKVTVLFDERKDSTKYGDTSEDPAKVKSIVIKIPSQIQKQQDFRVKATKKTKLEHVQPNLSVSYAYKSTRVKPETDTVAVSNVTLSWDSTGDQDLRVKILARRANRISKANAGFRAKNTPVKPEPDTAAVCIVASSWDSTGDKDLRAKILARRASYRNSKADANLPAMSVVEITEKRPRISGHYITMGEQEPSV
jgi:hypothetical protein